MRDWNHSISNTITDLLDHVDERHITVLRCRHPRQTPPPIRRLDDGVIEISLTQDRVTYIDAEDLPVVESYTWYAAHTRGGIWYARTSARPRTNGASLDMQRLLLPAPPGYFTDHIDRDGLNNRRSNLRIATRAQNSHNRGPVGRDRKYKGITLQHGKYWQAAIRFDGRSVYLGHFPSPEAAACAFNEAAKKYHGEFAYLNVINDDVDISHSRDRSTERSA